MEKADLFIYLKGLSKEERKRFYEEAEKAAQEPTIQKPTAEEVKMVQAKRLISLYFPEAMKMSKDEFLAAIPLPKEGSDPILVVSAKYVTPHISMSLIEFDGRKGKNYLNLNLLEDDKKTNVPHGMFYWRYGLDDGKGYCNVTPDKCFNFILKANRLPGTANEAIYVIAQRPAILKDHFLDCPGSRCSRGCVPHLGLLGDGRPRLSARGADDARPGYGSFSFGE